MGPIFAFELKSKVKINVTGLSGEVLGRAEYARSNPSYLVSYADKNGRVVEDWISEEQLSADAE